MSGRPIQEPHGSKSRASGALRSVLGRHAVNEPTGSDRIERWERDLWRRRRKLLIGIDELAEISMKAAAVFTERAERRFR